VFVQTCEAESGRMPLDATRLQAMTRMIRYSSNEDATRVLEWVGEQRLLDILQSPRFRLYDAGGPGGLATYPSTGGPPANSVGNDGDFAQRRDGGAGTTLYQRRAGAWVATGA